MAEDEAKPNLTLVGHAAFRPFRNVWMLEELGVPYTYVPCRPRSKQAHRFNPLGKVPALQDGDFFMYESAAINTYLGDKFRGTGAPELVPPAGTTDRGRYEQMVSLISMELDAQGLWIHRKHQALPKEFPGMFTAIPEAVSVAQAHFVRVVGVLAADLQRSGEPFLLGRSFSAADILFVHCLKWAQDIAWLPLEDADTNAILVGYMKLCESRDAHGRAAAKKSVSML
mmetsp:Transcript_6494/g.16185  ORF Transcript_6494/g.16185 Transcript_6494/m.16185 type:complete len:227 (-) Transcript_6494:51-731(-)